MKSINSGVSRSDVKFVHLRRNRRKEVSHQIFPSLWTARDRSFSETSFREQMVNLSECTRK